jgi:plastocyanin
VIARLLLALLLAAPGTIRGKITIKKKDGSDKKDYSEVVVYVSDVEQPTPGARAEILQKDRTFFPRVLAVAVGTQVAFPNADGIEHNVFSHSQNAEFDLGRFGKGPGKPYKFDKPGIAEIFCNIHKNMVAYVVVTPSKLAAVTAADGSFEITGVPPGKHKVTIWERFAKPKFQEVTVDVPAGGVAKLSHPITEAIEADPPHKNKFGTEYPANYK